MPIFISQSINQIYIATSESEVRRSIR